MQKLHSNNSVHTVTLKYWVLVCYISNMIKFIALPLHVLLHTEIGIGSCISNLAVIYAV